MEQSIFVGVILMKMIAMGKFNLLLRFYYLSILLQQKHETAFFFCCSKVEIGSKKLFYLTNSIFPFYVVSSIKSYTHL